MNGMMKMTCKVREARERGATEGRASKAK